MADNYLQIFMQCKENPLTALDGVFSEEDETKRMHMQILFNVSRFALPVIYAVGVIQAVITGNIGIFILSAVGGSLLLDLAFIANWAYNIVRPAENTKERAIGAAKKSGGILKSGAKAVGRALMGKSGEEISEYRIKDLVNEALEHTAFLLKGCWIITKYVTARA